MGFAESFIAGYTHGANAKRAKEQTALQREEFDQRKQEAAQRFKLDSDEAKARRDQQTLNEKLALINIQKMTPAALPDLSKSGGMGPPQESDMPAPPPSIGLDVAGQHLDVPGTTLEAEQSRGLAQQRAALETAASVKEAPDPLSPEAETYLTGKPASGRKFTPADIAILGKKAGEESALKRTMVASDAKQNVLLMRAATNLTPLTDEFGNFTGQLMDKTGQLHENPQLAGLRGKPLTGQVASRVHQAGVVLDTGHMLLDHIDSVAGKLGPLMGRKFRLEQLIGNPDPDINQFGTELASFAALQPALHGFRGQNALKEFEKIIGGPKNTPEALAASIQGIMDVGGIINRSGGPKTPKTGSTGSVQKPSPEDELNAFIGGQ